MSIKSLHDLIVGQISDVYDAEKQITQALPKMAEKATNEKLAEGFQMHLQETERQIERLDQVIELCGIKLEKKTCEAMKGLVQESEKMMKEIKDENVLDAALITAAQKVEHYEIASYGSLVALARCLNVEQEAITLLEEILDEEKMTDEKLTQLAEEGGINDQALEQAA